MVPSWQAEASVVPSGAKATAQNGDVPGSKRRNAPVSTSQSRIAPSSDAEASVRPSGLKAT